MGLDKLREAVSKIPPPKSDYDKLLDALDVLNRMGCEYEIRFRQMTFKKTAEVSYP